MKLIAIVVASLFHVAALKELAETEYTREDIDLSRLQDLEAGAEVVPEQEIPDDVQEISPLVEGELFEGDADLTDEQKALMDKEGSRDLTEIEMRQALNGQKGWERYKWPKSSDGKVYVPYTFQNRNSYTRKERANIFAAFKQYESKTCLRMIPKQRSHKDYIQIYKGRGCSSKVGRTGGMQQLSLAKGCLYNIGTPFHEFMHAIGYLHEQSRSDRDNYVRIKWQNIPKRVEHNFKKNKGAILQGLPYDTGSVMHYGATAFGNGRVTIQTLTGAKLGQRDGPSNSDIVGINKLYCEGSGTTNPTNPTRPTRPACEDKHSDCENYARGRYCRHYLYARWMETNCQKSCNLCRKQQDEVRCTDIPTESAMSVGWTCQDYADDGLLPSHCPSDKWKKDQICGKTCADAGYLTDPDCEMAKTE